MHVIAVCGFTDARLTGLANGATGLASLANNIVVVTTFTVGLDFSNTRSLTSGIRLGLVTLTSDMFGSPLLPMTVMIGSLPR